MCVGGVRDRTKRKSVGAPLLSASSLREAGEKGRGRGRGETERVRSVCVCERERERESEREREREREFDFQQPGKQAV